MSEVPTDRRDADTQVLPAATAPVGASPARAAPPDRPGARAPGLAPLLRLLGGVAVLALAVLLLVRG